MTRAAKQKLERQSTANFVSSQPLFDALRIGFVRVGEQKAQLSIARDIVQHLNVHSPALEAAAERDRYQRSIDCAVRAWRSATEIYADIFQSLAKATAANSTEKKAERRGHDEFTQMSKTATAALRAANSFTLFEDVDESMKQEPIRKDVEDKDSDSESEEDESEDDESEEEQNEFSDDRKVKDEPKSSVKKPREKGPVDATPTHPILLHLLGQGPRPEEPKPQVKDPNVVRYSDKIKYDSKGRKILWDRGAEKPNVPYGTLGGSEKKAWKHEKRRQRREKRREVKAAKRATEASERAMAQGMYEDTSKPLNDRDYLSLNGHTEPTPTVRAENVVPKVEYEDLSAEVEDRMKSKDEQKAREKKEKKRKRESGASAETMEVNGNVEKPKKKRTKEEDGTAPSGEDVKEKRSKHKREPEESIDGESRKKRKKSKE